GRNIDDLLHIADDTNYTKHQKSNIVPVENNDKKSTLFKDVKILNDTKIYNVTDQTKKDQTVKQKKINYTFSIVLSSLFITLFSVVIILIKGDIRNTILGVFRIPFEILIFLILSLYIIRRKRQIPKISGIVCAKTGFCSGIFISFFKFFYFRSLWTIFNIITESLFLLLLGLIFGLVFGGLFYSVNSSIKQKYARNK
ncbi:MAG: hypothetical protein PHH83_03610, partial [Patescibacteria group bacterium]|nr:hypothetical protein [Patescibacteria group bacterium]